MKNAFIVFSVLFALMASFVAEGAAATGNCQETAVPLTSDGVIKLTLTRLWNTDTGDWEDAAPDNEVKEQSGGYWYKFSIPVGSDCVFYIDPATVVSSNGGYYLSLEEVFGAEGVNSIFDYYYDPETKITYWYIRASDWEKEDTPNVTFYALIAGDYPGVTCDFSHYCASKTIADFLPAGTELSPINIDVSIDDSRAASDSAATAMECYYKASLSGGRRYVFSCARNSTNDTCSILFDPLDYSVEYDYSSYVDDRTGECIIKVLPTADLDAVLTLSASDLTDCTFSWHQTLIGTIGFEAERINFSDTSGVAVVRVKRSSNDVAHRIKWMTVAETAQAGVDYTPMSGELAFEADGAYYADIEIPLVPGADVSSGARSFAIRLESLPEDKLADGEYSPTPTPRVAHVSIAPTGEGEPEPGVPEAVDEEPETPLAYGTFSGECESFGDIVSLTSREDGTVTVTFGTGADAYVFEGDTNEVSFAREIGGKTWNMYLSVSLPSGIAEDLEQAPCGPARLEGSLYRESSGSGDVIEEFISCELYREETRLASGTLDRMQGKAGRYTISLAPSGDEWHGHSRAYGYLTLNVSASGETEVTGLLPGYGGTEFLNRGMIGPVQAVAYDTEYGIAVPLCIDGQEGSLMGTLKIGGGECTLSSDGGDVLATGGKYDSWTYLDRLYNGCELIVDDLGSPFYGLELSAEGGAFHASDVEVSLLFDRTNGVLSATGGGRSFTAVLFTFAQTNETGAVGFATNGSGNVTPLVLRRVGTNPDWSENWGVEVTVSFDVNGGTGNAPADISAEIGGTIILPTNTSIRTGYEFGGWINQSTGVICGEGEEINTPAEDTVFTARWIDRRLSTALDTDLVVSVTSESAWGVGTSGTAVEGGSYLKANPDKGKAYSGGFSITVDGSGTLGFWWKLVRRVDIFDAILDDRISVSIDGDVRGTLFGADSDRFVYVEVEINGSGQHVVSWDAEGTASIFPDVEIDNAQSAVIAVDGLRWEPTSSDYAMVTFDPGEDATVSPEYKRGKIGDAIGLLPTPICAVRDFVCWTNSAGIAATADTPMPKKGLALYAQWEAKTWTVSFASGGAQGAVPAAMSAKEGAGITLPSAGSLSMGGDYELAGWTDGAVVHEVASTYTVPSSNVTLTAVWSDVRFKNALDTDLAVSANEASAWLVERSEAAVEGDSYLKANTAQGNAYSGSLSVAVDGPGTLGFWWKLVRRMDAFNETLDDSLSVSVDGNVRETLVGTDTDGFVHVEVEINGSGQHVVSWNAAGSASAIPTFEINNAQFAVIAVDGLTWTPSSTDYATVTFDPGEGATVRPVNKRVKIGVAIGSLPTPVSETRDFVCWTNALGVAATAATIMPEGGLSLYAQWEAKTWTVSFAADGAQGDVPEAMSAKEGAGITLPSGGNLSMGGDYELAGWADGAVVHKVGSTYTVPSSNVTLTAAWTDVRYKNALDTDLAVSAAEASAWLVEGAGVAVAGGSYLKASTYMGNAFGGSISVTVDGSGTLGFWWKLVRREDIFGAILDDRISVSVDGDVRGTLFGADSDRFVYVEVEINGSGQHVVSWDAEGTASIFPDIEINNLGSAVMALDCVTWTPAAPVDFSEAVVTSTTTPSDLGITNGTFAAEEAGSASLSNLVAWAKAHGVTVDAVNGMTFTKDPQTTLEKAYLLNCAEEEVDEKAAEFVVTSLSVLPDGTVLIEPSDGSPYGNGHVEVRYATSLTDTFEPLPEAPKMSGAVFIRIYLVK